MNQTIFNICLWLLCIIVCTSVTTIIVKTNNLKHNFNKNNISHKEVTANNLTYNCNKNNISQLYGNNSLSEHFEPYDGSYTNGFSVNNVLCSNFDVSKSLTTTANMTFYNTTETEPNKTDKNKTITISPDGNITIKSIDNIKIQEETNKEVKTLLQVLYPKGSIYMSMNSTSPATFIGGEWTQIDNKFLYCTTADSKKTGGADTVTLKTENLPSHNHGLNNVKTESSGTHEHNVIHRWLAGNNWITRYFNNNAQVCSDGCGFNDGDVRLQDASITPWNKTVAESAGSHTHTINKQSTDSTGNNSSFSILPSYIKIYCWYRTK